MYVQENLCPHTYIVIEIIERENEKKLNIQFLDEEFQIHFYIM